MRAGGEGGLTRWNVLRPGISVGDLRHGPPALGHRGPPDEPCLLTTSLPRTTQRAPSRAKCTRAWSAAAERAFQSWGCVGSLMLPPLLSGLSQNQNQNQKASRPPAGKVGGKQVEMAGWVLGHLLGDGVRVALTGSCPLSATWVIGSLR